MPVAPRKICAKPNCGKLTTGRFCEQHNIENQRNVKAKAKTYDNERGNRHQRGYDSKWSAYSKRYRIKHPLCLHCEKVGIVKQSECVDHIIPVDGPDDPLFWDEKNHQALCHTCHSIKTAKEDGAFGNAKLIRSI